MRKEFETYKGLPCISREINPKSWTWTYLYENKLAKKNRDKFDSLMKNYNLLNDKKNKVNNEIDLIYNKFLSIVNNKDISINDINNSEFDNLKGVCSIRNKICKNQKILEDINYKIENIDVEIKNLKTLGFEDIVRRETNEIVYAYDMQNYVKLHPEKFNKKIKKL